MMGREMRLMGKERASVFIDVARAVARAVKEVPSTVAPAIRFVSLRADADWSRARIII